MAKFLPIDTPSPQRSAPASGFALWNLGFRPFYLLASIFAALSVALWTAQYAGYLPDTYLRSQVWHGHEMLFGYAMAVITGFLFTAVRTWTNQPTPTGLTLAAFAAFWLVGRVLMLTPYETAAAWVNAAFPVAVAVAIGIPLVRSGNRRNYFFVVLLLLLGLAVLALHLSYLGTLNWPARASLQAGLDLVLAIMAVVLASILTAFTYASARMMNRLSSSFSVYTLYLAKSSFVSLRVTTGSTSTVLL